MVREEITSEHSREDETIIRLSGNACQSLAGMLDTVVILVILNPVKSSVLNSLQRFALKMLRYRLCI